MSPHDGQQRAYCIVFAIRSCANGPRNRPSALNKKSSTMDRAARFGARGRWEAGFGVPILGGRLGFGRELTAWRFPGRPGFGGCYTWGGSFDQARATAANFRLFIFGRHDFLPAMALPPCPRNCGSTAQYLPFGSRLEAGQKNTIVTRRARTATATNAKPDRSNASPLVIPRLAPMSGASRWALARRRCSSVGWGGSMLIAVLRWPAT